MTTTYKDLVERGKEGKKFIGAYLMMNSEFVIEVMKSAGFDFLIFDLEHERLSLNSVVPLLYASEACGMATVVRVPKLDEEYIKKALDIGASCVKVPNITTAREAELVVEYSKYPPEGHRGACPFVRGNGYGIDRKNCYKLANERIATSIIVEGSEGIANLEEIIAVKGIDTVSIGQVDLSVELGVPGDVFNPKVINAVLKCADLCQKHGKQLSAQIVKPQDIEMYKNHPAITHFHTDLPQTLLYNACKDLCDNMKKYF